jgi:streptogramin lyase
MHPLPNRWTAERFPSDRAPRPPSSKTRGRSSQRRWAGLAVTAGVVIASSVALASPAAAAPYTKGDLFVSVGNGLVKEFTPAGTVVQTLDTTTASTYTTGSAFDTAGNFYVTSFQANAITKFDTNGARIGPFGSGFNADPESIVFDAAGNAYVGQADGSAQILKFDATGALIASFTPTIRDRGTDWIDLAADQCTIYYNSEGSNVHRFNVCTNTQLSDFTTAPLTGGPAYALRILPDGGVLAANSAEVTRLDNTGAAVQHYTAPGDAQLFALNLDPDGTTFWTALVTM